MSHKTFKVCILIDNLVENFYIKHYIDEFQPVFSRFKGQVFQRNPTVNVQHLKIYWIDGENDEILIACEEDFRLFLEEGKGRKIFFSVNNSGQNEAVTGCQAMEAEDIPSSRCDRKSRKGRDEERERRQTKKLAEKLKYLEENCLKKEEKGRRFLEKREYKHVEKLEKAKRRVEQIRNLIGSIDPANLNSSNNSNEQETEFNVGASTSNENTNNNNAVHPSPETIRLLSNAIAGCLQPCSLINKILNEVIGMIPQMVENTAAPPPYTETQNSDISMEQRSQATNTSSVGTPKVQQGSNEIEALFKEAAKELEKMNEIVNSSKPMDMSTSVSSGTTGITQIERVFMNINDSAISNATVVNMEEQEPLFNIQTDETDNIVTKSMMEDPPKSMRSRDSSIEVHDINSVMSDDSRDWTILDQEEFSIEQSPRLNNPISGAIPKKPSVDNFAQVDFTSEKLSIETQTPADNSKQHELQASVQKSIEIVQKSIENIQKSMETAASIGTQVESENVDSVKNITPASSIPVEQEILQPTPYSGIIYPQLPNPEIVYAQLPTAPPRSQANVRAAGRPVEKEPAVIVYDPNPKINSSIHKMIAMGFTNEDNWLTQLMVSVDGDIAKAADFLTPQKKNVKMD